MNDTAAILQAARDGDMPVVERLLTADPRLVHASDEYLKTPLHWAAEYDRRDVAQMLLDSGADLEATTSWGATPLDWAATLGSTKVADLLLARGARGMNLVARRVSGSWISFASFSIQVRPSRRSPNPLPRNPTITGSPIPPASRATCCRTRFIAPAA